MVDTIILVLTLVTALGCGLTAGTCLVFSTTIMRALGRLAPHAGIAAMQAISVVIVSSLVLAVFLATAVACAALWSPRCCAGARRAPAGRSPAAGCTWSAASG